MLREHVALGRIAFGINHEMRDFETGRKKNLDLVVCTPGSGLRRSSRSLLDLVDQFEIELEPSDTKVVSALPRIAEGPVGSVHLALEAKACMTEHIKALPRLHDELNSSHAAIHGNATVALAAGLVMINLADEFISPDRNKHDPSKYPFEATLHKQPKATIRTVEKVREIPRRVKKGDAGFDAIGIVVVAGKNDGSPFTLVTGNPAPQPADVFHYDQFIRRLAQRYTEAFEAF